MLTYTTRFTIKAPTTTITGVLSHLVTPGQDFFSLLSPWHYVVGVLLLLLLVSGFLFWGQRLLPLLGISRRKGKSKNVK